MTTLAEFSLTKMSATENDFLVISLANDQVLAALKALTERTTRAQLAKVWCHRFNGLGADGLVFLEKSGDDELRWDFYNADGSSAEMCGNAARCVGLYAQKNGLCGARLRVLTGAGPVEIRVQKNEVEVSMPPVETLEWGHQSEFNSLPVNFDAINTGVPHAVVQQQSLNQDREQSFLARYLRHHSVFGEPGANVTFYQVVTDSEVHAITFERGVEGFTRSCGTGAVAAAVAHSHKQGHKRIQVHVPGGDLVVDLNHSVPLLTGPAQFVAEITPYLDF